MLLVIVSCYRIATIGYCNSPIVEQVSYPDRVVATLHVVRGRFLLVIIGAQNFFLIVIFLVLFFLFIVLASVRPVWIYIKIAWQPWYMRAPMTLQYLKTNLGAHSEYQGVFVI